MLGKLRSGGRIRVADRIVAIDEQLLVTIQQVTKNGSSNTEALELGGAAKDSDIAAEVDQPLEESGVEEASTSDVPNQQPSKGDDTSETPSNAAIGADYFRTTVGEAIPISSSLIDIYERRVEQAERNHEHVLLAIIRESAPMVVSLLPHLS
ncbi:unnamed protein product [Toxocara canis]|uniref:PDZ domain-containing protein n=1 Tax=Toxocara canis TaxID=6265 RepID=A0A183UXI3_TOXCA|nr:unnamed protein product [Toxocara canis]